MDYRRMRWLNPPPASVVDRDRLEITTGDRTDFWQRTYYGFTPDSGHALLTQAGAGFVAEVTVEADWSELYDQAGLMVRADFAHWMKCGVEVTDGKPYFSVVVTEETSDWSTVPLAGGAPVGIRVTRMGDALFIQYREGDGAWRMARLARFDPRHEVEVGPMACTPKRAGLTARFGPFSLGPVTTREIH